MVREGALLLAAALPLLLAACGPDPLARQPRAEDDGAFPALPRGQTDQPEPAGTVAQGDLAREAALSARPPLTARLVERGGQRFAIYCAPCHGALGDGQGMIARRGFPHPPSFHQDRLRKAPDSHFVRIIGEGYGAMYSYAARVAPADRWAIAAYIRALQLSQSIAAADLPEDLRRRLPPPDGEKP